MTRSEIFILVFKDKIFILNLPRSLNLCIMTDVAEREAVSSWSRCKRRSCVIFGVLCLVSSMVLLLLVFLLFKPSATKPDPTLTGERCGGIAIILFLIGGFTLIVRYKIATNISSSPPPVEVVVSEIPVEDLEKSPSAFLPYKSISHHQPFDEAFSADLPDYFTTMQNSGHVQTEASLGDLPDYFTTIQQSNQVGADPATGRRVATALF